MNMKILSAVLLSTLANQAVFAQDPSESVTSTETLAEVNDVSEKVQPPAVLFETQDSQACDDRCINLGDVFCKNEKTEKTGTCYEGTSFENFMKSTNDTEFLGRCSTSYPRMPTQVCPFQQNQCGDTQNIILDVEQMSITPRMQFGQFRGSRCAYQLTSQASSQLFVKTLKNTRMYLYVSKLNDTVNDQMPAEEVYESATINVFGTATIYIKLEADEQERSDFHLVAYPEVNVKETDPLIHDPMRPEDTEPMSMLKTFCMYSLTITTGALFLLIIYGIIESSVSGSKFELDQKKDKKPNKVNAWYEVAATEEKSSTHQIIVEPASPQDQLVDKSQLRLNIDESMNNQDFKNQDNALLNSARSGQSKRSSRSKSSRQYKKGLNLDFGQYMQLVETTLAEAEALANPAVSGRSNRSNRSNRGAGLNLSARRHNNTTTNVTGTRADDKPELTLPPINAHKSSPLEGEIEIA